MKSRLKWSKARGQEHCTARLGAFEIGVFKNVEDWRWWWTHAQAKPFDWYDNHGEAPDLESAKLDAEESIHAFVAKHFTIPENLK